MTQPATIGGVSVLESRFLSVARAGIVITTNAFDTSFFYSRILQYLLLDDFRARILHSAPHRINPFSGTVTRLLLEEEMGDFDVLREAKLYPSNIFSVGETLAILRSLTETQIHGQEGDLARDGTWNVIGTRLKDTSILFTRAKWMKDLRRWCFSAYPPEAENQLGKGNSVIIRG